MQLRHDIEVLMRTYGVPAIGLALVGPGAAVSLDVWGERRHGSGIPVKKDDRWHVGSCGKSMTATLMARLVERGLLEWEAPIAPILVAHGIDVHPDFSRLTLRHLLTHRAGLPTDPPQEDLADSFHSRMPPRLQRAALAQATMTCRPTQTPGQGSCYSNLGYTVAGVLAETITDQAWEDLMQQEVFDPLGLSTASFGAPGKGDGGGGFLSTLLGRVNANQPWGHMPAATGTLAELPPDDVYADNPPLIGPAGTVHLSLPDFAQYIGLHASGGETPAGYLSRQTVDYLHMLRSDEESAFGWYVSPAHENTVGQPLLWHDGSNNAWYAAMLIVPKDRRGMAFVCNAHQDSMVDGTRGVVASMMGIYTRSLSRIA
jgi:CubicO group peptidase (beta-lactamase class C family)